MKNFLKFILIYFITFTSAYANDSAGAIAAGGITFQKTPGISMEREELTISSDQVKVAYQFKNNTDKTITTQVLFPLPAFKELGANGNWDNEIGTTKQGPFTNFSVLVQGQPTKFKIISRAVIGSKDVTQQLLQAHLPLNPGIVTGKLPSPNYKNIPQWQAKAKQLNLLDAKGNPKWQKQITYVWLQTFPAHTIISIEHNYQPATGVFFTTKTSGVTANDLMKEATRNINEIFGFDLMALQGGPTIKNWLGQEFEKKSTNLNDIHTIFYTVSYILTTGANWDGPIKNFTLNIIKPNDGLIAYNNFYTPQKIRIINSSKKSTIVINNFVPRKNLQILFVTKKMNRKQIA